MSAHWEEFGSRGYCLTNASTASNHSADSFWRYNTPTGNAVVDATNSAALKRAFDYWFEGYGKYGIRAMWMDQSEPDHSIYIAGGQWRLAKGLDTSSNKK